MVLERWEKRQDRLGNKVGAEIAHTLRKQFGDIPERSIEIKRFSSKDRESLKRKNFIIHTLSGQSLKDLMEAGRKFAATWFQHKPEYKLQFENLISRPSQVAINPESLFLPQSNYKNFREQEEMMADFNKELSQKIKGIKAVIGEVTDYAELAFVHLDVTGEYLFGKKHNYDLVRTKTLFFDDFTQCLEPAYIGSFHPGKSLCNGLEIRLTSCNDRYKNMWVAPLIFPK